MKRLIILSIIILSALTINAQNLQVRDFRVARDIEMSANGKLSTTHSSIKPYRTNSTTERSDSIKQFSDFVAYNLQKPNVYLNIAPLYNAYGNFCALKPANHSRIELNETLGFFIDFSLKDKLNINYAITERYLTHSKYQYAYSDGYNFDEIWGFYTENPSGLTFEQTFNINYTPVEFFSVEAGNGRHFYGDGYRSLLQSDYGRNFPYLKIETEFLNFKYTCVWSMLSNSESPIYQTADNWITRKYNASHYLDCRIGKHVNLSFFESIVSKDFLSFEYFNPVIFFRPIEFSMGSNDNALMGMNLKVSFSQKNCIYGQLVLDDIIVGQVKNDIIHCLVKSYDGEYGWFANKWGLQGGIKFYDIFKVKNLDCFVEANTIRPYVYSHGEQQLTYTHKDKPLAHPLGANFVEGVAGISYFNDFIECRFNISYAIAGEDSSQNTHFGQNIFYSTMDAYTSSQHNVPVSSYYNVLLQGVRTNVLTARAEVAYYPLKGKALSVFADIVYHSSKNEILFDKYLGFCLGIRSGLTKK